jgi:hypothetical protein
VDAFEDKRLLEADAAGCRGLAEPEIADEEALALVDALVGDVLELGVQSRSRFTALVDAQRVGADG